MLQGQVPVLVVSPHYDDAILSAFALLDERATVLTVFTGRPDPAVHTAWDQQSGFSDSTTAMDQREREDERAFDGLASARGAAGLLDDQYVEERNDDDGRSLLAQVTDWLDASPGGVIALPAGAGGPVRIIHRVRYRIPSRRLGLRGGGPAHPDHLWVTDGLVAGLDPSVDLVLYEDLPYAWVKPADERVRSIADASGRHVELFTRDVDVARKGAAIECYASQRRGNVAPWVTEIAEVLPSRERFWWLRAAAPHAMPRA